MTLLSVTGQYWWAGLAEAGEGRGLQGVKIVASSCQGIPT